MKRDERVRVLSMPERFGKEKEYQRLIGRCGTILGVRYSDQNVLVKVDRYLNPISFEKKNLQVV
jgi:hypothetical protein